MTFAAPLFLLAALAAAIPVVLHLVDRRRVKQAPFPTLRFIKASVQKTRRRKRIQDLLLMLLRAALLFLLAAALARPVLTSFGSLWGNAGTAVVIVLDNSASMGAIDRDRVRLDTAAAAATQILDQLDDGDRVALIPTCGPPFPNAGKMDGTQQSIRQILRQCRPSYERANLALMLRQARKLLDDCDAPNKQIFILTDMQRVSWAEDGGVRAGDRGAVFRSNSVDTLGATAGLPQWCPGIGNVISLYLDPGEYTGGTVNKPRERHGVAATLPPVYSRGAKCFQSWINFRTLLGQAGSGTHQVNPAIQDATADAPSAAQSPSPEPLPPSPVPVIVVDCNREPKPNAAVEQVEIETPAVMVGLPLKVAVTLSNASSIEQQRLVELVVEGVKQAVSPPLELPPRGRAKHEFRLSLQRAGLHRGEVRLIGEDGSKYDDRRFFAIDAGGGIPVAVVKSRRHEIPYLDDAYYIEQALAAGPGGFRLDTFTAGDLADAPLDRFKVVFCVNLPALDAETAARLADYAAGGGNLVWIAGDNVDAEAYNRMNQLSGGRLLPAPLGDARDAAEIEGRDSWHVGFLDGTHAALRNLAAPPSLYESVLVYRHERMAADRATARVLTRLDDGEPLLVERVDGGGRVLMLGVAATASWTNLPLRPIFMPLLVQLTTHLSGADPMRTNLIAGQPLEHGFAAGAGPIEIELIPPDGETLRLQASGRFRYPNTHEVGIYELRVHDAEHRLRTAYAVNFDPAEADPTKIAAGELEEMLGGAPLLIAEDADDLTAIFVRLREGRSLWGTLLAALLILLIFETFVSNRFGGRASAT